MLFNLTPQPPAPPIYQAPARKISWFRLAVAIVVAILIILVAMFFVGWAMDKSAKSSSDELGELSDAQKLEILSKLGSNETVAPLSEKEKLSVLGKLSENKNATVLSEEEKLKILGQLVK